MGVDDAEKIIHNNDNCSGFSSVSPTGAMHAASSKATLPT